MIICVNSVSYTHLDVYKRQDVYYPKFVPDALFKEPSGNPFAWDRAFSREFLIKRHLKFPEDVLFGEDLVFIFQAAPQARGIQFISDKLHYYQCFRQGSLMNRYGDESERRLAQHVRNMRIITDFWYKKGFLTVSYTHLAPVL